MASLDTDSPNHSGALILVGSVAGTFGLKGAIRIFPLSDDPNRLLDLDRVFVGPAPEEVVAYSVSVPPRFHRSKGKTFVVVSLQGVEHIETAESMKGRYVYAHEEDLPLSEDEVFLHDLLGLKVVSEDGRPLGKVSDVSVMPAHPVLIVELENGRTVMIPSIPAFVREIDEQRGTIVVSVIEGLID